MKNTINFALALGSILTVVLVLNLRQSPNYEYGVNLINQDTVEITSISSGNTYRCHVDSVLTVFKNNNQ